MCIFFFFSSRRRHTRCSRDWSSDVCSSDLGGAAGELAGADHLRDLLLHALHAGLPLLAGVRLDLRAEAGAAGSRHRADPGRRLFLGIAHGGGAAGGRARGHRVQPVSRQVHLRYHGSGRQVGVSSASHFSGRAAMRHRGFVAVIAALVVLVGGAQAQYYGGGGTPPAQAQDGKPALEKGVKARNLVTSLGGFRGMANVPVVLTGQIVEIEPGGQTGRQRHQVPSYIYVLEGTLTTNSEGGPVGVAGAQYHTEGQSYMDAVGLWHNHSNSGQRSEERRVGKECRSRWSPYH